MSLTKSLITSKHDIVLQHNAIIISGSFTQIGTAFGNKDTINPIIARGIRQYPTALIDWNRELILSTFVPFVPKESAIYAHQKGPHPKHEENVYEVIITILFAIAK